MKPIFTGWRMVLLTLFLGLNAAQALPPAPDGLIYGLVKDQFGNPLVNPADQVILQTSTGMQVIGYVQPNLAIGVNYAIQVPMDVAIVPTPYVANALTTGTQYKLYVVINTVTNLPIEMEGAYLSLAGPAAKTLQNLTVGGDSNGDGIPDAWETAFLASIGVSIPLTSINPNHVYTSDGRTLLQQYELGNFPYVTNAFNVTIVSQNAGSVVLAFTTAAGHTYTVNGSTDLQNWSPLAFTIPANGTQTNTSYYATGASALQIQTIQPTNAPQMQFFRLQLQ
jgi:hypothetical protein